MKVAVIGATGFSGEELVGLLLQHSKVTLTYISRNNDSGLKYSKIFPRFEKKCSLICESTKVEKAAAKADFIFLALPHKTAALYVPYFLKKKKRVIDLSADYRLKDSRVYKQFYGIAHKDRKNLKTAVYGLPEFFLKQIKSAELVANPGCYPTVSILALAPLLKEGVINPDSIIIDAKSGITGAGRKAALEYHYAHFNQNLWAYKVFGHQHLPEIEQVLKAITAKKADIQFTPHVVPLERGILATIYGDLKLNISSSKINAIYKKYYNNAPFIRLFDSLPQLKDTSGTNFCDIGFALAKKKIVIVGCIDNLLKGAAGQAVQNMNIMNGWDEKTGLL